MFYVDFRGRYVSRRFVRSSSVYGKIAAGEGVGGDGGEQEGCVRTPLAYATVINRFRTMWKAKGLRVNRVFCVGDMVVCGDVSWMNGV